MLPDKQELDAAFLLRVPENVKTALEE